MPRLKNTILPRDNDYALYSQQPMVDLRDMRAGQQGYYTDFGGYVSNAAYVRRHIIPILLEYPLGFHDLAYAAGSSDEGVGNVNVWVQTLRNLIELHPQTIEGLNSTLEITHDEHAVGGAGEMQQNLTNVTRTRSTPTFTWVEKYGRPIHAFFNAWVTGLMMDPITKAPNITSYNKIRHRFRTGDMYDRDRNPIDTGVNRSVIIEGADIANSAMHFDLLPDYYSMSVLFFEPDPSHTRVIEAWLCTNMQPMSAGDITGSRDLTAASEMITHSIEFTALTQVGFGVRKFAQSIFNQMNLINPQTREAFLVNKATNNDQGAHDNRFGEITEENPYAVLENNDIPASGMKEQLDWASRHNVIASESDQGENANTEQSTEGDN